MENPEIIQLNTNAEGKLVATLAYRDPDNGLPINDFNTIREVPVNLRPLQLSARGNVLVDQSIKSEEAAAEYPVTPYDGMR